MGEKSFTMKCSIFLCVCLVIIPSGKIELGKDDVISDWPSRRQKNHSTSLQFLLQRVSRGLSEDNWKAGRQSGRKNSAHA